MGHKIEEMILIYANGLDEDGSLAIEIALSYGIPFHWIYTERYTPVRLVYITCIDDRRDSMLTYHGSAGVQQYMLSRFKESTH